MKNIMFLILFVSSIFSYELYKEIKISHIDQQFISNLHQLDIHLDHVHMESDNSIQFAISQSDLNNIDPDNFPSLEEQLQKAEKTKKQRESLGSVNLRADEETKKYEIDI